MNFWFTSDTHFGHTNIVKGVSQWENKEHCRNFKTLEEHDETLIENINKIVKQNDILYHLGDFCMGGVENILKFRNRLIVKNIHLVLGNHCQHIEKNAILKTDNGYINAHNLFTSVNQYIDKKINGQNMFLCHYAMRVWHKAAKGAWHLYGHSHNNLPNYVIKDGLLYKSMDVGVDTHPEFRPYSYEELSWIFNKKEYIDFKEDHHK